MYNKASITAFDYLSKYDIITKFLTKNIFKAPKIKTAILSCSINKFMDANEQVSIGHLKPVSIQQKLFLSLYLYFSIYPYITVIKTKYVGTSVHYFLKLIFNKSFFITQLLFSIFVENYNLFNKKLISIFSDKVLNINTSNISILIPSFLFSGFEEIIKTGLLSFNLKDLIFNLNLILFKPNKIKPITLVKNLNFFWIV